MTEGQKKRYLGLVFFLALGFLLMMFFFIRAYRVTSDFKKSGKFIRGYVKEISGGDEGSYSYLVDYKFGRENYWSEVHSMIKHSLGDSVVLYLIQDKNEVGFPSELGWSYLNTLIAVFTSVFAIAFFLLLKFPGITTMFDEQLE